MGMGGTETEGFADAGCEVWHCRIFGVLDDRGIESASLLECVELCEEFGVDGLVLYDVADWGRRLCLERRRSRRSTPALHRPDCMVSRQHFFVCRKL